MPTYLLSHIVFVGMEGLEPSTLSGYASETYAYTNSATCPSALLACASCAPSWNRTNINGLEVRYFIH